MASDRKKGVLILSMPRAGSNWLGSITNASGTMGNSDEWLDYGHLTKPKGPSGRLQLYTRTLAAASTENGRFAVKIFPRQLLQVIDEYEFDFIRRSRREHDTRVVVLEREDRVAQAISLVRAMQSGAWSSQVQGSKPVRYNFGALCQAHFHIGRGYAFWQSYLSLSGVPYAKFTYESLQKDSGAYFETLAAYLDVPPPQAVASPLTVQRDQISTEWRTRFLEDVESYGIPASAYDQKQPEASLENALKVLRGKPAKITRFGYSV